MCFFLSTNDFAILVVEDFTWVENINQMQYLYAFSEKVLLQGLTLIEQLCLHVGTVMITGIEITEGVAAVAAVVGAEAGMSVIDTVIGKGINRAAVGVGAGAGAGAGAIAGVRAEAGA